MTTNDYLKQVESEFEKDFPYVCQYYPEIKPFTRQKIAEAVEMAKKGEI